MKKNEKKWKKEKKKKRKKVTFFTKLTTEANFDAISQILSSTINLCEMVSGA